ncbi:MAG: hypothetical protein IT260_06210 [Saprospiraceae bacterium]|nr:hypothetical protein [Saprospiraceae bacterium]
MKEVISSNSLFHFTRELKFLKSILQDGFRPNYCLENFDTFKFISGEDHFEMAVPMVCFCDIPLSKVKSHMNMYGYYGIGLSKAWGIQNGISPLFYISPESATTNSIYLSLLYLLNNPKFGWEESLDKQYDRLLRLIRFTKPYVGPFFRKGKFLKNPVTFYDEREWRFIPDVTGRTERNRVELAKAWLDKATFLKMRHDLDEQGLPQIVALNQELQLNFPLKFELSAIRYIIIKKESEIPALLQTLKGIFKNDEIAIIASKILTQKQIFEDF